MCRVHHMEYLIYFLHRGYLGTQISQEACITTYLYTNRKRAVQENRQEDSEPKVPTKWKYLRVV